MWIVCALLVSSSILLVNSLTVKSAIIGIIASILYFLFSSTVLGRLFYRGDISGFKTAMGSATLLILMALPGAALILLGIFSLVPCMIVVVGIALCLSFAFVRFDSSMKSTHTENASSSRLHGVRSFLLGLPFLALAGVAFGLLWLSRTGEGVSSVWLVIPDFFVAVFLLTTLSLATFSFFAGADRGVKLGLVALYSLLAHSLFWLVWFPGRYGDSWSHLGEARYIARNGMPYAYSRMVERGLWVDLVKYRAYDALVVFFERMFCIDVYWVHVLFIPVLWSVFTTVIAYKTAEALAPKENRVFPILTAMTMVAFPSLVSWGAVSVPNSLGFIFFFLSVPLLLFWVNGAGRQMWFLAFLSSVVSLLVHPQAGFFAFMLLLFVSVIHKTSNSIIRVAGFTLMFISYPLALYLQGASFSLTGLFQIGNFLEFQSSISTILLGLGLVGLMLGVRDKIAGFKSSFVLLAFYLVVLFEYYLTGYGMSDLPFGSRRILAMADFLLVPFVAMGLLKIVQVFQMALQRGETDSLLHRSSRGVNLHTKHLLVGLLLIGVFLSLQSTVVLYQAYPRDELVKVQPSAYEVEAIQYIEADAEDRYVVLCEPGFASLAIGFLGTDYGYVGGNRGGFGYPEWWYPTIGMYVDMTESPSTGHMQRGMDFANATVSYFVVSVRNPDFEEVLERTSRVLPVNAVFGNGKLYVFKYPLSAHEEPGLPVSVGFANGTSADVETEFVYMVDNEINATLTVSGSTSYNISDFPNHWTFLDSRVNDSPKRFDNSSDVNSFVYITGLEEDDILTVKWLFNRHYPIVGWKEDSFKRREWRPHELFGGTMTPNIIKDGDIMSLSYSFTPGTYWYYYYTTSVGLSTDDYPYIIMRWRADNPVAVASVYFEAGGGEGIVPLGSQSSRWITTIVQLPSNAVVNTVMIGLSNVKDMDLSGMGTLEVDYVLFVRGSDL